jgi:hypothetical protein
MMAIKETHVTTDNTRQLLLAFFRFLTREKDFAVMEVKTQSLCDVTPEDGKAVVAEFLEGEQ